jgi:hypothetical protein
LNDDPLAIAAALGAALDAFGVRWAIGGSVASSVHGIPRATQDVDIVVALPPYRVRDVVQAAAGEFLMDEDSLRADIQAGRSSNVFHAPSMTKIDLFPAKGAFERNQLDRAIAVSGARVITAEDAILTKLRWFRLGDEVSDRQWRDVAGIVALNRGRLDVRHLERWAIELQIADLLARAFGDASGGL